MDPNAYGVLATTALSMVLPYLGKAGEAFSEKAGERLFEFLKARFEKRPAAGVALEELGKAPQDDSRQQAMHAHIRDLLAQDPAALKELQSLLAEIRGWQAPAVAIQQNAGDNSKQLGQVFGNVSFGKD